MVSGKLDNICKSYIQCTLTSIKDLHSHNTLLNILSIEIVFSGNVVQDGLGLNKLHAVYFNQGDLMKRQHSI